MSVKLHSQPADRRMAADMADAEQIAIGAAAERKRRRESDSQIEAVLASDEKGGRAVYWRRQVRDRESIEVERAGTYSARGFLRLAEKAAGQAGRGRWNRPEAVEAVAAELVARTLAKTGGTLPVRGSLGRDQVGHEDPDLAYLTASARRLIVSAQRGDHDAAGLAAEAAPVADVADDSPATAALGDLMAEAEAAAEGPRDAYLAEPREPGADLLSSEARSASRTVAELAAERPAAVEAALVAAMRGNVAKSADLADAGYASSPGSARKAAQRGREVLRKVLTLDTTSRTIIAPTVSMAAALESLCEMENRTYAGRLLMEVGPTEPYRRPKITWPDRTQPTEPAPVNFYRVAEGGRS